jgi:hypothetical protein
MDTYRVQIDIPYRHFYPVGHDVKWLTILVHKREYDVSLRRAFEFTPDIWKIVTKDTEPAVDGVTTQPNILDQMNHDG